MIETAEDASPDILARYDAVIDVRSPAEFAEDRLPGAINLPVLSNEERAEVGTIYKQVSRFRARLVGAAHVARNVAGHLDTSLADKPNDFRPLLYCWRGGMRSGSMATILSQIGWRVGVLKGGYKTWRREVVAGLRGDGPPLSVILIDGETGTAKTEIVAALARRGAQTLDLERYAAHRGSVFGAAPCEPQPTQKLFETRLWNALRRLDPARPLFVEAESAMIGRCEIPDRLWKAMQGARAVRVEAPLAARARYLTRAYADIVADEARARAAVERLKPFAGGTAVEAWRNMIAAGDHETLAFDLMEKHYDPLYARARLRRADREAGVVHMHCLDTDSIERAADEILAIAG